MAQYIAQIKWIKLFNMNDEFIKIEATSNAEARKIAKIKFNELDYQPTFYKENIDFKIVSVKAIKSNNKELIDYAYSKSIKVGLYTESAINNNEPNVTKSEIDKLYSHLLKSEKEENKKQKERELQEAKEAKEEAEKQKIYKKSVAGMKPLEIAIQKRMNNIINESIILNSHTTTWKNYIDSNISDIEPNVEIVPKIKWNSRKYNRMTNYEEQEEYEKKTKQTKNEYQIVSKSTGRYFTVKKLIYDYATIVKGN